MSKKLSVIIVNYNVVFFLEQCLHSVMNACRDLSIEIWVVDNDSKDDSVEMVKEKFPSINLIANQENLGFSKANNQAIHRSDSQYVLLLNPDTVVEENTFEKIINFMDSHPNTGGLGVKMIDGKGDFLPESKRGLPTPMVALYKITGLAKLFPNSRKFGKYHLGYLDKDKNHKIEILSGAFMMLRKSVLDEIGLLDEDFFMYGEDIDLSYRIIKAGYDNHYYSETSIIHYKGESTKKSSVNYVFVFYRAMVIFAKKHFSNSNASMFSKIINIAIWLRASIAIASRFVKSTIIPFIDISLLFFSLVAIKKIYESYSGINYTETNTYLYFISFSFIWVISMFFTGSYDKAYKLVKNYKGLAYGSILILIVYSLLPEDLRFSRAIILIGLAVSFIIITLSRLILGLFSADFRIGKDKEKNLIIGSKEEISRVSKMMLEAGISKSNIRPYDIDSNPNINNTLSDYISFNNISEVIFCAKDISSEDIIKQMSSIKISTVNYKIAPPESLFIIGSNSSNNSGDFLTLNINEISKPRNRKNKRLFDILSSLILILLSPVMIWFVKRKGEYFKNAISVFLAKKTWISYDRKSDKYVTLPKIKEGIFTPNTNTSVKKDDLSYIEKSNILYAKDYLVSNDIGILLKKWTKM